MSGWRYFWLRLLIFSFSLAVFFFFNFFFTARYQVTGDEPHYLLAAHSLAWDLDIDLANNFAQRHWRDFWPVRDFGGHRFKHPDGSVYSAHGLGLPLLLAVPYRFGGLKGARWAMMVIGAWLAVGIFNLSLGLGLSRRAAAFSWLAASFTIPLVYFSFMFFNELPAALFFVWGFGFVLDFGRRDGGKVEPSTGESGLVAGWTGSIWPRLIFLGLLFYLPWLHFRYLLFSLFLLLAVLIKAFWSADRSEKRLFFWSLAVSMISVVWLYFYWSFVYQTGRLPLLGASLIHGDFWWGILGLFFDRAAGLFFLAPVYALALAGVIRSLLRRPLRWEVVSLYFVLAFYLAAVGSYYRWDAGTSPVARYLVPVLPFLAVAAGAAYDRARQGWPGWLMRGFLALSWLLALGGLLHPIAVYANQDGSNYFSLALDRLTGLNWSGLLPDLYRGGMADRRLSLIWLLLVVLLNLLLFWPPAGKKNKFK